MKSITPTQTETHELAYPTTKIHTLLLTDKRNKFCATDFFVVDTIFKLF